MGITMFGYKAQATVGDQAYPAYELRIMLATLVKYLPPQSPLISQLYQELQLNEASLAKCAYVKVWQVHLAMQFARQSLGNAAGALIGQEYHPKDLDLLLPHFPQFTCLQDCFLFILKHPKLVGSLSDSMVMDDGDYLTVRWLNNSRLPRQLYCDLFVLSITALVTVARHLTAEAVCFDEVDLHGEGCDVAMFPQLTQSLNMVHDVCQWRLSKRWLALPITAATPLLPTPLDLPVTHSISDQVLTLLRERSPIIPAFAQVALALNLSERTLRRRLAQSNISYQLLVDLVRSQAALDLIIQGQLSVNQISEQLGYGDVCHFRQSFKHWLGLPPGYFRK
ncbi:AraC family transcriptional regulator [Shewanella sp. NIFS-20-20]|uniref:helix-turn-helix transcriptional regulator n=1 Tax=Shewanella sp. NIFS-20-20 TaxID=2853806 RepID=UPI001C4828B0|nr:AraC family transcriptional regulator [Shewanella sp. NIFS-20-20]MBV7316851.1 helix-turn-helix transcriptional regulator [Shewanella sp. NIFS-20-20]